MTNTVNGKQYVGQTTRGAKYRWSQHILDAKQGKNRILCHAIRKYGASAFTLEVIDTADNHDDLDAKEIHWIKGHGSLSPGGYNLAAGGQRPPANNIEGTRQRNRSRVWSQESRAQMRFAQLGKTASPETKAKLSAARKGRQLSPQAREASRMARTGATTPDSVRQKLREANQGRKHTDKSRQNMAAGQQRMRSAKGFLPFQELRGIVRGLNLNGAREYVEYAKTHAGFPTSPPVMYKNEWGGWGDFLGHVQRLSYAEAVRWVEPLGLRCAREYHEYLDSHSPPGLPKYPDVSYAGEGWTGWAEFLGSSRFVPYQEAVFTVRPMGFSGSKAYMAWVRDTHPKGFPSWPSKTYKGAWWVSWEVYLGKSPEVTEAKAV